jgi:hypothetical protein
MEDGQSYSIIGHMRGGKGLAGVFLDISRIVKIWLFKMRGLRRTREVAM